MLLLPGHQHDLWHQYCADKLLTSQDLLCSSLVLILMHSVLLVWKNIFMVNTSPSRKGHYSGFLPLSACQDELLVLYPAYIIVSLYSRKPTVSPGIYFSNLCPFLESCCFWKVHSPSLASEHVQQLSFNVALLHQLPLLLPLPWSSLRGLHKPFL